jgi:dolichyl-phosphate-mannose--protein O-mannosyl transferase
MAPLYLQYLMLAVLLAECWSGKSRAWEHVVLVLSLVPACVLGFGATIGTLCLSSIVAVYAILPWRFRVAGKFVCVLLVAAALAAFVYFLPVWLGMPLEPASYNARIWLRGPGVGKWM